MRRLLRLPKRQWGVASRDPLTGQIGGFVSEVDWNKATAVLIASATPNGFVVWRPVGEWQAVK